MSILTTSPLKIVPAAATDLALTLSGTTYTNSAWTEIIASTGGIAAIAGITMGAPTTGTYSSENMEFDIGVGTAGNEIVLGTIAFYGDNSAGSITPNVLMLPIPMGGIPSGSRVAIRTRNKTSVAVIAITVLYYEGLDSDQFTSITQVFNRVPVAADGVSVTPHGTAWTNSNWFELTSGLGTTAGIYGLALRRIQTAADFEYDIGIGAGGSEVVITTLRDSGQGAAIRMSYLFLPGLYFIPASTRVAVRMRKTGTSTSVIPVSLLYIQGISGPSSGGGAGKGGQGKGGGGVSKYFPGGANLIQIGNPGLDFS